MLSEARKWLKLLRVPKTTLFIPRGKNDELNTGVKTKLRGTRRRRRRMHSALRRDLEQQLLANLFMESKILDTTKNVIFQLARIVGRGHDSGCCIAFVKHKGGNVFIHTGFIN